MKTNNDTKTNDVAPDVQHHAKVAIHISRRSLIILGILLIAPWLLVALVAGTKAYLTRVHSQRTSNLPTSSPRQLSSKMGPWGELQTTRIITEPPEEFVISYLQIQPSRWIFRDYTTEKLDKLFTSAGLTDAQRESLLKKATWDSYNSVCVISPDEKFVKEMSPHARAVIYITLSTNPENGFQNEPFRFRSDSIDEWFEDSGLSEQTIALVKRLIYQRGMTALFSDLNIVLPTLSSSAQKIRLVKTLSRQSTLIAELQIRPDTDVSALAAYWGIREGRTRDIRPLLDSLTKVPNGCTIDIVHLLPRFARKRLYSYPSLARNANDPVYDCYWSSMNFWNDPPDDRFGDLGYVKQVIESEYYPVYENYAFGDVMMFMASDTEAIHSAVYIADDILFTKNGSSVRSPWIFMRLDRLVAYYQTNADLKIRAYRRKN
jgi:hypothetical protein